MSNGANQEIGRILRANTSGFAVGCRVNQLSVPSFGSLVKAQPLTAGEAIYGLIYEMNIDDDQLIRRLVMMEDPRPEAIEDQRSNRLLPIEMSVITVGYSLNGDIRHGLPPRPPLNLDPVQICVEADEVRRFTDSHSYLRLVLRAISSNVPVEQLLVAHIVNCHQLRGADDGWATAVVAELVSALRSDYEILIPTLEALSELLPTLPVPERTL